MVDKLAPNPTHSIRWLVKYFSGRGFFRAVPSQNGDKFVTSSPPPPPIVERVERPLTQKTLRTMFYVKVESAAVSVVSVKWSPSSLKIVCVTIVCTKNLPKNKTRDLLQKEVCLCVYSAQVPVLCRVIAANIRLFVKEVKITIRRGQALNLQRTFRTLP